MVACCAVLIMHLELCTCMHHAVWTVLVLSMAYARHGCRVQRLASLELAVLRAMKLSCRQRGQPAFKQKCMLQQQQLLMSLILTCCDMLHLLLHLTESLWCTMISEFEMQT